jgi:hypothetical protein
MTTWLSRIKQLLAEHTNLLFKKITAAKLYYAQDTRGVFRSDLKDSGHF